MLFGHEKIIARKDRRGFWNELKPTYILYYLVIDFELTVNLVTRLDISFDAYWMVGYLVLRGGRALPQRGQRHTNPT
ncbi:hypothetical protein N9W53_00220 [bacterium]|nr:hypothetical protein [bacterium]